MTKLMEVILGIHKAQGDDLCWMDIDRIFEAAGLPVPDRKVGDQVAMLRNCEKYIGTMCSGGKWSSYARLRAVLKLVARVFESTNMEQDVTLGLVRQILEEEND